MPVSPSRSQRSSRREATLETDAASTDHGTVRKRRIPGEARKLLLESARNLFSEQGYRRTTTRQIANEANVSEPLLFRHFGSKAGLFDAAMLEPYHEFISELMSEFVSSWQDALDRSGETEGRAFDVNGGRQLTRRYVSGLYDLMRSHSRLFLSIISARAFEGASFADGDLIHESDISRQLDRFDELLRHSSETAPPKYMDSTVSFRLIVGAVMAAAVFDDWLFPSGSARPSDERILSELTQFTLYGTFGKRVP